jgi:S1-C subfamily serine protease
VGIQAVNPGSPADDAGLEEGDVIVGIEGTEIKTTGDLFKALSEHRSGDEVTVEYYRGDERQQAQVTLG